MIRRGCRRAAALAGALAAASGAAGEVLRGDTTWSGVVRVEEDVYVPPGSRLSILPGTRVIFASAPSTKTDPVFWSGGTEVAVAGTLTARGEAAAPVSFEGEGGWGGVVAAPGGRMELERVRLSGAQEALLAVDAALVLRDVTVVGGEYGVVLGPGARVEAAGARVEGCRVGVLDLRGAGEAPVPGLTATGSGDAALLAQRAADRAFAAALPAPGGAAEVSRVEFLGEHSLERSETWRGEVVISGRVTVAPGAVLTLAPGTRVAFRRVDSNGDGLGESELLVLGGLRSLGSPAAPVVFESAEEDPRPGDWDKVSLISSEDPDNLVRFSVFRHGVQALHAHFSGFRAEDCYFEENLRAAQFQESPRADVVRCVFRGNKQALRFRDSKASVTRSVFVRNLYAVHAFRCDLEFEGNTVEGSALGGFLAKESRVTFRGNRVQGNRDGARLRDPGSEALVAANRFEDSAETALSLSLVTASAEGNLFDGAGLDLVAADDAPLRLRRNVLGRAGRDALHLEGAADAAAEENYWGGGGPARRIHDGDDEPGLGRARWEPALREPPTLSVPPRAW